MIDLAKWLDDIKIRHKYCNRGEKYGIRVCKSGGALDTKIIVANVLNNRSSNKEIEHKAK
jgi:hypothetical protein